jgi:hypothetical protein
MVGADSQICGHICRQIGTQKMEPAPVTALARHLSIENDPIREVMNRRVPWATQDANFAHQAFGTGPSHQQGWKLHVSATPLSAVEILEATLDVLLREGVRFKVLNSIKLLSALNSGLLGISQIGKFITVYPSDDSQAVRLAVKLDEATRGRRGPRVPTDRPLRPDSLVHYRYGAMIRLHESQIGIDSHDGSYDMVDPAGRLMDDVRLNFYRAPHPSITDPFEAAGVRIPPPTRGPLLNGRYFVCDAMGQSPRGGVFRAIDAMADPARVCLLKEAWHDVGLDPFGRDAYDWAANEEYILTRYAGDPMFPRFFDRFEVDGNRYIAIEYLEGMSLDRVLSEQHSIEEGIDPLEVIAIGLGTANLLAHLHEIGLIFRDFKPANTLKTLEGHYRLIDFGIAYEYKVNRDKPLSTGTPPFYSREQYDGHPPCPADDIFAWGAVLHYLAGGDASFANMPKGNDFLQPFPRTPLSELQPSFPAVLAKVIDRAVAWERADRFPAMREARDALAQAACQLEGMQVETRTKTKNSESDKSWTLSELDREEALRLAREVGDALCQAAEDQGGGLCWKRRFEWIERTEYSPDLYGGAAGIGLFLAELARETGEERYADAARGAARWVAGPIWGRGRTQHGFHSGEAGVAFFFLRLAELLDQPGYLAAADLRLRRLRGAVPVTIDLMYGTAGTVLGLLAMHAVTGSSEFLADARALGDQLVESALTTKASAGYYWEIASSAPGGPVTPHLGLLHGGAGIGLALACLGRVTGEEHYFDTARGAAELLIALGVPSPSNTSIECEHELLAWPGHLGGPAKGLQAHCHGAGGIGQFLLWLDGLRPDPRYRAAAKSAGSTVAARRTIETRTSVCHGVSGTGHFMLDCHQKLGGGRWLTFARECASNLQRFRVPERPGVYAMHDKGTVSPDLMLGYAGIGSFFLRITRASNAPDLIFGRLGTILEGGRHRNGRGSEGGRNVRENTATCSGAAEFG